MKQIRSKFELTLKHFWLMRNLAYFLLLQKFINRSLIRFIINKKKKKEKKKKKKKNILIKRNTQTTKMWLRYWYNAKIFFCFFEWMEEGDKKKKKKSVETAQSVIICVWRTNDVNAGNEIWCLLKLLMRRRSTTYYTRCYDERRVAVRAMRSNYNYTHLICWM